jgi:RNA polymerase sigma-70 factor (ECF subfamily)
MNDEESAQELLDRVARHDPEAFGALYNRFAARLLGMLVRVLPARQEAQEVLQKTFVGLWNRAKDIAETRGSVAAWLVLTGRQMAIDRIRARRISEAPTSQELRAKAVRPKSAGKPSTRISSAPRPGTASSMNSDLLAGVTSIWLPAPKEIELTDERLGLLQKVIRQLPKSQQRALELAVLGGYTEKEIAQMLGEPLGKAKSGLRAAVTFVKHRRYAVMGQWAANI